MERSVEGEEGKPGPAVAEKDLAACEDDVPQASEVAVAKPVLDEALAERIQSSQSLLAAYKQAMGCEIVCGAMPDVETLENEVKQN